MYWTVFISLILGALGFPIPEELPLIVGGLAVASGELSAEIMFGICFAGVLIGDQFMYFVGRFIGNRLLEAGKRSPLLPAITEERINEVRDGLRRKRLFYIFVGRHLFFLRSVTFLAAGSLRIPFLEFFFADFLAACFSVSIFFGLGYWLGGQVSPEFVPNVIHYARTVLMGVVCLGLFVFIVAAIAKSRRKRLKAESANAVAE